MLKMNLKRKLVAIPSKSYRGDPCQHKKITTSREAESSSYVTVSVGNYKLMIKKFTLVSLFPHFERMFNHPLLENSNNLVECKEINVATLESLFQFANTNILQIDINNVQKILLRQITY